ncbi:ring finger domain protein [Lentinula edodes]|uniref:RING-type E3 ubiquitin transferase n=1 Tax=Lentinula edodes TaxID=5353 RepID=A0A1Q3EBT7_LENED|nr:ring finger domain protein [Lentinula edodes]
MANRPVASGRYERRRRIPREIRERSRRERDERDEADRFERALAKRKWIYRHDLYAKHVASNSYTRFRPFPTPAQFAASPDLISRTTSFLRRELLVWMDLDVEFLTTFIISLMKAIDIRSESAVKLLAEFLDMDAPYVEGGRHVNAEHFAHEVYSYVRSPYKDLFVYDTVVQYETPPDASSPRRSRGTHRQRSTSPPHHISHAESPHPSSKGKGKAVADVSMPPEPTPAVEQTIVPSTSSTTSAPKRPPRFVDLHDSIQVHLRSERSERTRKAPPLRIKGQASLSSLSSEAHGVSSLSIKGQGTPSLSSQSNPPSLLSRLSDTYLVCQLTLDMLVSLGCATKMKDH